jgi:hypothetical protein
MRHFALPALLLAGAVSAVAQVNKSNLTGVVNDPSGAGVPAAAMRLVNTGTGAARQESTDPTGFYRFTLLDFGIYRLEVERPGFKKFVRGGIQLQTGETTTVDVALEVGELAESIAVTAESPLLRTETGSLGATVNRQVVNELPLIGRNPYVFVKLAAGIQYLSDPSPVNPWDVFAPSGFAASGSKARSEFLLDGIPNMSPFGVSFSPSPDAVEEMRLHTNTFDAEYGHSGSAFVNVSTKSGANQSHGSVYWFLRDDQLNANSFFNNLGGLPKSASKLNTYGFALSGPAYLPKLYDGRDRTHYSLVFEGTRMRKHNLARDLIPSPLERAGDFSRTIDRLGRPFSIYDPLTTRPSGSGYVRSPFPGNVIPAGRQDPVAVKTMKFYPVPNRVPTPANWVNFEQASPAGLNWASVSTRADQQLSKGNTLFLRYGWNHRFDPAGPYYGECCREAGNPIQNGQSIFSRGNIGAGAGYTWVKSPSTVIDFRAGFTRYFEENRLFSEGFDITRLGFPESLARTTAFPAFPGFSLGGDVQNLGEATAASRNVINVYNALITAHTMLRRHALKYGLRYQIQQQNVFQPGYASGVYLFSRVPTQGPDPTRTAVNSGHGAASFLLGTPTSGFVQLTAYLALQNRFTAVFFQDDWKVSHRLTLNLGLRLEKEGPVTDRFDRGNAGFDFSVANPIEALAKANYAAQPIAELPDLRVRGGLGFLAAGGAPRGNLQMPALAWAPRIGFAYRLTGRMVWRAGWGIFQVPNNFGNFNQNGFSLSTQMVTSLDNNLTPYNRLSNPFPNGLSRPPGAKGGLLTGVGQSITAGAARIGDAPAYLNGLTQQFSMGFQFLLPGAISVESSYVGNISQRLTVSRDVNQYPDQFLALKTRLNARVTNPFHGVVADPASALSQPTTTVSQLLRPFPHFLGLTQAALPYGRSHYDSLQVQLGKRMSHGLYFGAAYTFSKFMEATSYLRANDPKPARVISDADRPQLLVLHGAYELPLGRGKRFLRTANPVVRRIAGGWQFNWVATFNSGAPLAFSGAERISRSTKNPKVVDQWFDATQFVPQEPFTLRRLSSRVADLRSQGIRKWDLSLLKSIRLTERVALKIQAEFYNAWNTTHFGTPITTVTSSSFGRIGNTPIGPREIQLAARLAW